MPLAGHMAAVAELVAMLNPCFCETGYRQRKSESDTANSRAASLWAEAKK